MLVIGCQRSGTTLLRLILEAHRSLACFDEKTAYGILAGDAMPETAGLRPVFKIPRFTEQIASEVWSDFGERDVKARYSGQPLLFLLREPLDVVSSMLRLVNGVWYDSWVLPILHHRAARDPQFAARWERDRAYAESTRHPREAIAAFYWLYKTEAFERYRRAGYPVYGVSYEALVARPERVLRDVVAAIGEPWDPRMLAHHLAEHGEVDAAGLTVGNTDVNKPIHGCSVGVWRDTLDETAAGIVRTITDALWSRVTDTPERILRRARRFVSA